MIVKKKLNGIGTKKSELLEYLGGVVFPVK